MESGASKLYAETLRVLKENQTIEVLYEVHHPGQSGFQHCYLWMAGTAWAMKLNSTRR